MAQIISINYNNQQLNYQKLGNYPNPNNLILVLIL